MIEIGMIFGRLKVICRDGNSKNRKAIWLCRCRCGNVRRVIAQNLVNGGSKSCGCLHSEIIVARNKARTAHGMGGTSKYDVWQGMLRRCSDLGNKNYGARGIKVCSFIAQHPSHIEKVAGERPRLNRKREFSIDRIDNNGNYSCGSCVECLKMKWPMNLRWVTQKVQCRNFRKNRLITIKGITKCLAEWCELSGLKYGTILMRIKLGWESDSLLKPLTR